MQAQAPVSILYCLGTMDGGGREGGLGFVQEQSSITTILRFVISRNDMIQVFSVQIQ